MAASEQSSSKRADGGLLEAPLLREQIYDRLRSSILSGELEADTRLSPAELAERYGVSTMPVREALRLLQLDGLIETSPRRWTRVAAADPKVAEELYPILSVLEAYAVRTAPGANTEAIARAREANDALATAANAHDVPGCLAADDEFHRIIVHLSSNGALHETIADLKVRIRLLEGAFFRVEDASASIKDHAEILDALVDQDMELAAERLTRNWERSLHRLRVILATPQAAVDQG
ncbi:MAG: GntR family transcriptional regulator [Solirubrobacterales bacterium]